MCVCVCVCVCAVNPAQEATPIMSPPGLTLYLKWPYIKRPLFLRDHVNPQLHVLPLTKANVVSKDVVLDVEHPSFTHCLPFYV